MKTYCLAMREVRSDPARVARGAGEFAADFLVTTGIVSADAGETPAAGVEEGRTWTGGMLLRAGSISAGRVSPTSSVYDSCEASE